MTTTAQQALPRIVQFIRCDDSGEYGADSCAHCGADGRYQYVFRCDDGKQHAAMAGCIQRFPVSPIAGAHKAIMEKQRAGKDLNGWDRATLAAIESFYAGDTDEATAQRVVDQQARERQQWVARKYSRRR